MPRATALLTWVLLLTIPTGLAAQSASSGPQRAGALTSSPAPAGGSSVKGKVVYADSGRPLRRAQVTIYDPAERGRRRHLLAWTNGRGEFQIRDVPAGKYFVMVSAPGVLNSSPVAREEAQRELTSVTVDGTSQADVTVRVKRGGAISGKVTYADGDPAVNAAIRVLRQQDGRWIPVYPSGLSGDRVLTDDRGVYRVPGLPPGQYIVGAAEQKWGVELTERDDPDGGNLLNRALLTTSYHGGAMSPGGATQLGIAAGEEKEEIDITLADLRAHRLSGVVTLKADGSPVARARLSLKRSGEDPALASELEEPVANTDEQGRFTFDEVPDGGYTMAVSPPSSFARRPEDYPTGSRTGAGRKFAPKEVEVTIAGADLLNLPVVVSGGGHISGVVRVEGGKPLPRTVLIAAEDAGGEGRGGPLSPVRVQPDGTFTLEGLPAGGVYLRASVPPDHKYYTKSVSLGRVDMSREPLVVKEDEGLTDVRIEISPGVAQLSGRVLASDGKSPVPGAGVLLVPADLDQQVARGRRMYGMSNADGSFRVGGAPGEYLVIVVRAADTMYQLSGEALKARAADAQRVVLQPGESKQMDLIARGRG